jgi:calcipressin-2
VPDLCLRDPRWKNHYADVVAGSTHPRTTITVLNPSLKPREMPGLIHDMDSSSTLVDSPPTEPSKRTNTLVLAHLPTPFFHPRVMNALRDHFASHGTIRAWAPLRTFSRVLVVYESEDSADEAKAYCDGLQIDATPETYVCNFRHHPHPSTDRLHSQSFSLSYPSCPPRILLTLRVIMPFSSPEFVLRVFRADPTPPTPPSEALLRPPALERNFLISPPGSPPVGWEPVVEDPPNAAPLADDLIAALRKLQLAAGAPERRGGREMILDPEDGAGIGVYVEDCDMDDLDVDEEPDWHYGEDNPSRVVYRPIPTSRPPMLP